MCARTARIVAWTWTRWARFRDPGLAVLDLRCRWYRWYRARQAAEPRARPGVKRDSAPAVSSAAPQLRSDRPASSTDDGAQRPRTKLQTRRRPATPSRTLHRAPRHTPELLTGPPGAPVRVSVCVCVSAESRCPARWASHAPPPLSRSPADTSMDLLDHSLDSSAGSVRSHAPHPGLTPHRPPGLRVPPRCVHEPTVLRSGTDCGRVDGGWCPQGLTVVCLRTLSGAFTDWGVFTDRRRYVSGLCGVQGLCCDHGLTAVCLRTVLRSGAD